VTNRQNLLTGAHGQPGGRPGPVPAGPAPAAGAELQVLASLAASLGDVAAEMRAERDRRARLAEAIWPVGPYSIVHSTTSSATIDRPELMGPRPGYAWDLKFLTAVGFSAGSVNVYLNGVSNNTQMLTFPQAGVYQFGKLQLLLRGGDRLVVTTTGITGTVDMTLAYVRIKLDTLSDYAL
jgi:hypothetical protein